MESLGSGEAFLCDDAYVNPEGGGGVRGVVQAKGSLPAPGGRPEYPERGR